MRNRSAPLAEPGAKTLDWSKLGGLVPAIVQDVDTGQVLMLGYMDDAALEETCRSGLVTFYSRSKNRLWQKGETSGNQLRVKDIRADCDRDALLVTAEPAGPTCHLGTESCFGEPAVDGATWLGKLARIVRRRAGEMRAGSYTAQLLQAGPVRIAQKVGEEAVEVVLASTTGDEQGCIEEIADLLYHLTVLMESRGIGWNDIAAVLKGRHAPS